MAYPSTLSTLATPQASDRLNNPSHSALHQNENAGITEIQTFVGTLSSAVGTLVYDIRATASDGGGHIQTAVKGGTGQISFTKGDLLVATSASVLSKLAIGQDNQVLQANSSTASGVKWVTGPFPKIAVSGSIIGYGAGTTSEVSVMSATIPGSTLGTSNAVRATVFFNNLTMINASETIKIRASYGPTSIATITIPSLTVSNTGGPLTINLMANNSASSQLGVVTNDFYSKVTPYNQSQSFVGMKTYAVTPSNVNSDAPQPFGVTIQYTQNSVSNNVQINGYVIEKIT